MSVKPVRLYELRFQIATLNKPNLSVGLAGDYGWIAGYDTGTNLEIYQKTGQAHTAWTKVMDIASPVGAATEVDVINMMFQAMTAYLTNLENLNDVDVTGLADGFVLLWDAASSTWKAQVNPSGKSDRTVTVIFDGGDSDILVNSISYSGPIDYAGTITGWRIANTSNVPVDSSIEIEVWKDTSANYPPTVTDKISGTENPKLVTEKINSDTSLSSWTTDVSIEDCFAVKVLSNTNTKKVELNLTITPL